MNPKQGAYLSTLAGVLCLMASAFAYPTIYPDGVTIHEAGVAEGYVLYGAPDGTAYMVDVDGAIVQTWSISCGGQGPQRALADGHILTNSCGNVTELDWGGAVVWEFLPPAGAVCDRDWERLPSGNTLVLCRQTISEPSISDKDIQEDFILEVTPAGGVVWEWHEADHFGEFGFSQDRTDQIYSLGGDWSHATAVSAIPDNTSHTDPRFAPGNVVLSIRHQNTMAVIDRVSSAIVWVLTDSVIGPHSGHMIPDDLVGGGSILTMDNGYASEWLPVGTESPIVANREYSQVVEIDPLTNSLPYIYSDDSSGLFRGTFFTYIDGGAQRLSNGNTLITEGSAGRIFEVTGGGEIVWEYIVPFRNAANSNAAYRAYKVPLDWAAPHFVPDLVVSGAANPDPAEAGELLGYTIDVANTGLNPAVSVEFVGSTPVGTTFQSISAPPSWSCATPAVGATGAITCSASGLSAGSVAAFETVVAVDLCDSVGTTITHTAAASSLGTDATPGDNSVTIATVTGPNRTLIQDLVAGVTTGGTDVQLEWGDWAPACGYRVMRSVSPDGGYADLSGLVSGTLYVDPGAASSPDSYYYLIQID